MARRGPGRRTPRRTARRLRPGHRGLEEFPGDTDLRYRAVLALARAGSTEQARRQFDALGLASVDTEDVAALAARIAKDQALEATGPLRRRLAAGRPRSTRPSTPTPAATSRPSTPATLRLVAGDPAGSGNSPAEALDAIGAGGDRTTSPPPPRPRPTSCSAGPTGPRRPLDRAADRHGGDLGAVSSTRRQLRLVCDLTGADVRASASWPVPSVAHFCGHRVDAAGVSGRFPPAHEPGLADAMDGLLGEHPVGAAYGALAGGADILWAEAVLAHGGELHVVLPFDTRGVQRHLRRAVRSGLVGAVPACLDAATSVTLLTEDAFLGDDVLFRYGSDVAMGLALLRARFLDAEAWQLAVWDGEAPDGAAGTAADVAAWRAAGHRSFVLRPDGSSAPSPGRSPAPPARATGRRSCGTGPALRRREGFSQLRDEQLLSFRDTCSRRSPTNWRRSGTTWSSPTPGATPSSPSWTPLRPRPVSPLASRSASRGSIWPRPDCRTTSHSGCPRTSARSSPSTIRCSARRAFMGAQVSRAARIEPVTVPGAVFVTEAFAAALELTGDHDVRCDYVGHMPTAKDYGRLRMYRLRRPTPRT